LEIEKLTERAIKLHNIDYSIDKDIKVLNKNSYLLEVINYKLKTDPDIEKKELKDIKHKKWSDKKIINWPISKKENDKLINSYFKIINNKEKYEKLKSIPFSYQAFLKEKNQKILSGLGIKQVFSN